MKEIELTVFDSSNVKRVSNNDFAYMRINSKGVITFSAMASDRMNLVKGDKIILANDNEHPQDWYIRKDPMGLPCRTFNNKSFGFSSQYLKSKIYSSLKTAEDSLVIPLGNEMVEINGQKWWALITKKIYGKQN